MTVCISRLDTMQDEMQRLAVSVTPLPRFPAEGICLSPAAPQRSYFTVLD